MKRGLPYLLILGVFALCISLFHAPLIQNLNSTLLGDNTDGIKNYFTPLYHINYAQSASTFSGMNYPYGDQVVFSDNQPTISIPLYYLAKIFPQIKQHVVGIMNGFMLISVLITAFLLFKILQFYESEAGIKEALFAILVALLSPQLLRMGGHYALSYGFAIPLVWWRLLCFFKTPRLLNSLYIGLAILFLGGIHLYYIALTGGLVILFHLFIQFASPVNWASIKQLLLHVFIQVFAPIGLLMGWIKLTELGAHRTQNPLGFLENTAFLESVFLPIGMPLEWKFKTFLNIRPVPWEGLAYVGLFASFFCLVAVPLLFFFRKKLRFNKALGIKQKTLLAGLISALVLLAYAFGFPFYYDMEYLLPFIGPLKQFRGIGRFAWVFFYVINIAAFVSCAVLFRKHRWVLWIPIVVLANDVWAFHEKPFYQQNQSSVFSHQFNPQSHWTNSINPGDFQAILPLPFYHTGSEYLLIESQGNILKQSMEASIATGLPLLAVQMSRTDISQTLQLVSLVLEPLSIPLLLEDLPNTKPLLLMYDKRLPLTPSQENIRKYASLIVENDTFLAASFDPYAYFKQRLLSQKKEAYRAKLNAISVAENLSVSDTSLYYFIQNQATEEHFTSFKNFEVHKKWTLIEAFDFSFKDSIEAKVCMWINIEEVGAPATNMIVEGKNALGEIVQWQEFALKHHIVAVSQGWALIETPLKMTNNLNYGFLLHNSRLPKGLPVARFMIYENGQQLILNQQHKQLYNNRFFE